MDEWVGVFFPKIVDNTVLSTEEENTHTHTQDISLT